MPLIRPCSCRLGTRVSSALFISVTRRRVLPQVYHKECLGFTVTDDDWECPRHFCGARPALVRACVRARASVNTLFALARPWWRRRELR